MQPQRILIARLSHLGDVVCALPLFHALRQVAPEAELGWVVQREFAGLVQGLPGLENVLLFDRRRGLSAWASLRRALADFDPDWAIDVQGNWKSAVACRLSGADTRIGMDAADWREPSGARFSTETAPPTADGEAHVIHRVLALAQHVAHRLGSDWSPSEARFDPALTEAELERGTTLARRHLPRGGERTVVLHLATPGDVRSWPAHYYEELARLLLARGCSVLLLSGPAERDHGHHLRHALGTRPGLGHWIDQNHLREASAFFTVCAERGVPVLASDSGPMHLAAACGARVVLLAGPQDATRTGPWPPAPAPDHLVLRAPVEPDCAPCLSRTCRHPDGPVCLGDLPPELVADRLTAALAP